MPELPEVETIVRGLNLKVSGLKISDVEVLNPKSFLGHTDSIISKKIISVNRRAKLIVINLEDEINLYIHLKMSGQVIWVGQGNDKVMGGHPNNELLEPMPTKSTRVIFSLSDNSKLYFNDQRKFGWIKVGGAEKLLESLGPEPLEAGFTWQILKQNLLKRKNTPIKVALLDQSVVAGVGNIYASEACFIAGVNPSRRVNSLSDDEFKKIHQGVVESLSSGIKHGGSSKTHFLSIEGRKGNFLDYAYVYNRQGEKCKVCGADIIKTVLGGRGTYYCQRCQK